MDIAQIQKRIAMMEQYSKEIKDAKEMLKEELESDDAYREAFEEAAAANTKKKQLKDAIMARGANQKLVMEIKQNTEETSLLKEILSAELMEVYKENETDEIADSNGETRKFKIIAKLLPRGAKLENRDNFGKYTSEE